MIAKEVKYAVERPEAGAERRARCFGDGLNGFVGYVRLCAVFESVIFRGKMEKSAVSAVFAGFY